MRRHRDGISTTTAPRGYSRVAFVREGEFGRKKERTIQRVLQKERRGSIHPLLCV